MGVKESLELKKNALITEINGIEQRIIIILTEINSDKNSIPFGTILINQEKIQVQNSELTRLRVDLDQKKVVLVNIQKQIEIISSQSSSTNSQSSSTTSQSTSTSAPFTTSQPSSTSNQSKELIESEFKIFGLTFDSLIVIFIVSLIIIVILWTIFSSKKK